MFGMVGDFGVTWCVQVCGCCGGLICFSCAFTLGSVGLCYRFDA